DQQRPEGRVERPEDEVERTEYLVNRVPGRLPDEGEPFLRDRRPGEVEDLVDDPADEADAADRGRSGEHPEGDVADPVAEAPRPGLHRRSGRRRVGGAPGLHGARIRSAERPRNGLYQSVTTRSHHRVPSPIEIRDTGLMGMRIDVAPTETKRAEAQARPV